VATVVEARFPWGASPDATIATDATVVMLSGVVTNASEKSVCPFPDVDEHTRHRSCNRYRTLSDVFRSFLALLVVGS